MPAHFLVVAKNLAWLRDDADVYQRDVARSVGVSPQLVSFWEHGYGIRRVEHLTRLADYFGVTPEQILSRRAK